MVYLHGGQAAYPTLFFLLAYITFSTNTHHVTIHYTLYPKHMQPKQIHNRPTMAINKLVSLGCEYKAYINYNSKIKKKASIIG